MLTTAVSAVLTALIKNLPEDLIKDSLSKFIGYIREKVEESSNKLDDAIVLPLLDVLERQLGIDKE